MKKNKKKLKNKLQPKSITIIIVLVACLLSIIILRPYYRTKDRTKQITKSNFSNVVSKPLGWLRVQGTNIDFPIFYYNSIEDISDPSYDLGWSFEDNKKLVNRTVLLSHNMRNVSSKPLIADKNQARFEQLMSYIYYDFVKDNKYIQYTINGKNYLFKIYAVYLQPEEDVELYNIDKKEKRDYIKNSIDRSYFKFNVDVSEDDKILTLVTCTRFYGDSDYSFVVDARQVRKLEIINNYKVTEKSNYNKIKKILKGDDSNEN